LWKIRKLTLILLHHIAEWSEAEQLLREDVEGHRLIRRWYVVAANIAVIIVAAVIFNVVDLELSRVLLVGRKFDGL
jgi:hypothetical protein